MTVSTVDVDRLGATIDNSAIPKTVSFAGGAITPRSGAVPTIDGWAFRQAYCEDSTGRRLPLSGLSWDNSGVWVVQVRKNPSYPNQAKVKLTATTSQLEHCLRFEYVNTTNFLAIDYDAPDTVTVDGEGIIDSRQFLSRTGTGAVTITSPRDQELTWNAGHVTYRDIRDNSTVGQTSQVFEVRSDQAQVVTLALTPKDGAISLRGEVISTEAGPQIASYWGSHRKGTPLTPYTDLPYGPQASASVYFDNKVGAQDHSNLLTTLDINGVRLAIPSPITLTSADATTLADYRTRYAQMRSILGQPDAKGAMPGQLIYDQTLTTGPLAGSRVRVSLANIRSLADAQDTTVATTATSLPEAMWINPSQRYKFFTYKTRYAVIINGLYQKNYTVTGSYRTTEHSYLLNSTSQGFETEDGTPGLMAKPTGGDWQNFCDPSAPATATCPDLVDLTGPIQFKARLANGWVPDDTPIEAQTTPNSLALTPIKSLDFNLTMSPGARIVKAHAHPLDLTVTYQNSTNTPTSGYNIATNYIVAVTGDVPVLPSPAVFVGYDLLACTPTGTCTPIPDYTGLYPGDIIDIRDLGLRYTSPTGEPLITELRFVPSTQVTAGTKPLTYIVREVVAVNRGNTTITRTLINYQAVGGLTATVDPAYIAQFEGKTKDFTRAGKPTITTTFTKEGSVTTGQLDTTSKGLLSMVFVPTAAAITTTHTWQIDGHTYTSNPPGFGTTITSDADGARAGDTITTRIARTLPAACSTTTPGTSTTEAVGGEQTISLTTVAHCSQQVTATITWVAPDVEGLEKPQASVTPTGPVDVGTHPVKVEATVPAVVTAPESVTVTPGVDAPIEIKVATAALRVEPSEYGQLTLDGVAAAPVQYVRPGQKYHLAVTGFGGRLITGFEKKVGQEWVPLEGDVLTAAEGETVELRVVSEPAPAFALPLTGGQAGVWYMIGGVVACVCGVALAAWFCNLRANDYYGRSCHGRPR